MNVKKKNRIRKALGESAEVCWFCGVGFAEADHPNMPPKTHNYARKYRSWIRSSLEHLHARALGGDDTPGNLVMAHVWCNSVADMKTLEEKHALRGEKILELIRLRDMDMERKTKISEDIRSRTNMKRVAKAARELKTFAGQAAAKQEVYAADRRAYREDHPNRTYDGKD